MFMGDPAIEFGTGMDGQSELRVFKRSIRANVCASLFAAFLSPRLNQRISGYGSCNEPLNLSGW
jgi:hypothetical protein